MSDKKADIYNSGKELFCSKGYKDTNISDIAKMAGIGVGTFYSYYSSKEKLFLEIFFQENEKLKKSVVESLDLNDEPVTLVKKFISAMDSNPILKEWYNRDIFSKLEQYYHEQCDVKNDCIVDSFHANLIKKWQAEGRIRDDIDDELIFAFFNALAYLDMHKREIGIQHFPQLINYLAEFIIKGITDCQK